jgi:hypothetical protein
MSTYGTFKVSDKKCATCNFYQGTRRFGMQAYKPYYVYADAGETVCLANKNRKMSANNKCPAWQKWVSIP